MELLEENKRIGHFCNDSIPDGQCVKLNAIELKIFEWKKQL